ncbi:TRAP transporter large permease [Martelella radicis]|uniref:TRAP transporter large permease protein n=1 Tax=Martelella radicis TaxID=1397476 RepID=A0A7W6KN78_9HYPH|nr:TRAP transporter large permease [Martelella radicis]MBB4124307.1 tripartite ATP-independent transporter DctM subunit [Martelella radicis]
MSNLVIGFAGFFAIVTLIGLRFQVGLALIIVAFSGLALVTNVDIALSMLRVLPYDFVANWDLSAVPMFLLMGAIAHRSGMTASLFEVARLWFSRLPGGLAVATNFACAGFASASGSSLATTMAIGRITIPEMRKYGYDPGLSAGIVACGGTLGVLIPPSIFLVIYGIFAEVSIAALFMAGVVPGLLTAIIYFAQIVLRCWLNPALAPPVPDHPTWSERLGALRTIWPLPLLILAVIGGIYSGIATPTEAGALGAFLALLIAIVQRRMSFINFRQAARESILATASIFFVAIGAVLLTRFMAFSGVPAFLAGLVADYSVNVVTMILVTMVIYLVLGMFLDPLGMMLLTLPVMLPMFETAGMNLVWFGILMVKFIEIGLITPPVGLNVYAVKILAPDYRLQDIFRGALWFLLAEAFIIALLIGFPQITLFLPGIM